MKKFDKVFVNGKFYSRDERIISCIGIRDGKIEDIECKDYQADEIIDLEGKFVYPGFTDAHLHLVAYAQKKLNEISLNGCTSIAEMKERIQDFIEKNSIEPDEWILGAGWSQELFKDKKYPNRYDLDMVSGNHPIMLIRNCYHICVVNSKALELSSVDACTETPEGGRIDKDENGIPTGIFRENAMNLITSHIPSVQSKEQLARLILEGCKDLATQGITTVHTDDFSFVEDKRMLWEVYKELDESNELPIRVVLQLRASSLEDIDVYKQMGLQSWIKMHHLTVGPIKIIADGSLGSRTAALEQPYSDDLKNKGIMLNSEKELDDLIRESFKNDFDICVHAIGDRTMNAVLDIYERYSELYKSKEMRPSIIHCQIASKDIIDKFKKLDIIANIQPSFVFTDWDVAGKRVGEGRLKYSYCWKKFIDKGVLCAGSSDAPIESFNPLYGIYAAVYRKDLNHNPEGGWMPDEKLSLCQAIALFTENAAYLSHEEHALGSFKIGKWADFVVLSDDLTDMDKKPVQNIQFEQTYVSGEQIESGEIAEVYA